MLSINNFKRNFIDFTFYAPALLVYIAVIVVTAILGFYYSFTNWDGIRTSFSFIGLENYNELFRDPLFYNAVKNTFLFTITFTILHNVFSLIFAMLYSENTRFNTVLKSLIFIPYIFSSIVVSYIWDYIYAPMNGVLSLIVKNLLGIPAEIAWTGDPGLALPLVTITQVWHMLGFGMVIYIAGLKGIPYILWEAAEIDGTNKWQKFRHVTLPLLAPVTTILVVFDVIVSLKVFELIYVMTRGGPGFATETVTLMVFREAFRNSRMGYSTAVSVVLFFMIFVITVIQLRFLKEREVHY